MFNIPVDLYNIQGDSRTAIITKFPTSNKATLRNSVPNHSRTFKLNKVVTPEVATIFVTLNSNLLFVIDFFDLAFNVTIFDETLAKISQQFTLYI